MATPIHHLPRPDNQYLTLLEVSEAIAAHRSLEELFQDLGRRLHCLLNFTYLSILLHDPERNVMRLHNLDMQEPGTLQAGMEFSMEESPSARVWQTQEPMVVGDVLAEVRSQRVMSLLRENNLRSFCSLP